jgi:major membrane immunogen (membrane-anchored lipoprotein)
MSRTVSARIPKETHEKLLERCNKAGCTINEWLCACIDYLLTGHSEFDFGDEESLQDQRTTVSEKRKDDHEGKKPVLHFRWEDDKLVQDETTWRENKIAS